MTMTTSDMTTSNGSGKARRVFTNEYKLGIVAEYDAATEHGARGALLRREGLYESHIGKWRRARDQGRLAGGDVAAQAKALTRLQREKEQLQAQIDALTSELDSTKAVLDLMGKASGLLQAISDRQGPKKELKKS